MKHRKNPLSTGAAIGLAVVAAVAVGGVGYVLLKKSSPSSGGALPGGKTVNVNALTSPTGSTVHVNAGDTISLTIASPIPGGQLVDRSSGGVKMTASSGQALTFSVSGPGTLALAFVLGASQPVEFYAITVAVP